MKRPLLGLVALGLAALAGYAALHRSAAPSAAKGQDRSPFQSAAAGQGTLIQYQPGDIPIRTLAWAKPLPGGTAVAQVLSQSGCQQVYLFQAGVPQAPLTLSQPASIQDNAFGFAELQDAAQAPGHLLLLLYRTRQPETPALLIAWGLDQGAQVWAYQGTGTRLVLSRNGGTAFLFGTDGAIQALRLMDKKGRLLPTPAVTQIPLPPGLVGLSDLLPTQGQDLLAAATGGLWAFQSGAWSQHPAPPPSALGFASGLGTLARTGDRLWWQPEPGCLLEVEADGTPLPPQDLSPLLNGPQARDAALLRLLGADSQGALWFTPEAPAFRPPPAAAPGLPGDLPVPAPTPLEEPSPAPAVAAGAPSAAPAPPPPASPEAWTPYLQAGLARLYRWTPGDPAMQRYDWSTLWPRLGAPQDISQPSDGGGLVPASGGFLLGGQEHRWWLPLTALTGTQPR
jgi:hypothetical protein